MSIAFSIANTVESLPMPDPARTKPTRLVGILLPSNNSFIWN